MLDFEFSQFASNVLSQRHHLSKIPQMAPCAHFDNTFVTNFVICNFFFLKGVYIKIQQSSHTLIADSTDTRLA